MHKVRIIMHLEDELERCIPRSSAPTIVVNFCLHLSTAGTYPKLQVRILSADDLILCVLFNVFEVVCRFSLVN